MVDFQSRDTRRDGTTTDDEEQAEEDGAETEPDEDAADPTPEQDEAEPKQDEGDTDSGTKQDEGEVKSEAAETGLGESTSDDPAVSEPPIEDDPTSTGHDHGGQSGERGHKVQTGSHDHGDHDHSHGHHAHDLDHLGIAVVTVSSSRSVDEDPSGDLAIEAIRAAGHEVPTRELIDDDYDGVQSAVAALVGRRDVDVVVTSGGTGVTPDDVTIEAVEPLFDKHLPGFGELFRALSQAEIGTRVVGTRATAGIAEGVPVFCLPGSTNAVELGVQEIVLEEAGHLAGLAQRE